MKVLLITTSFPQSASGQEAAGSFVADFARELSRRVEVVVVAPGEQEAREVDKSGLVVYRYRAPLQPLSSLKPMNFRHWLPILSTLASGRRVSMRAARDMDADFVLALWALPCGLWAKRVSDSLHIPYATWALGSDIWSLAKVPVVRSILKKVLRAADSRFADGYQLAQDVEILCGKSCKFLPSARQLPVCGLPLVHKPPYRLAFLGRWHPNKGVDLLLDALEKLSDDDWSRIERVRIAGGGPLETLVQSKVNLLRSHNRPVLLEGYKNVQEAGELLVWSDVVLIPSRVESIPVIFSDAIQAKRFVLVSAVGDFPVLLSQANKETTGCLVSPATSERIRDVLVDTLRLDAVAVSGNSMSISLDHAVNYLLKTIEKFRV